MANRDKRTMIFPIKVLADLGFEILATQGTADVLRRNGVHATVVRKHFDGPGPNGEPTAVQLIADGDVALVVNTPHGSSGSGGSVRVDGYEIRTAAVRANVPCITTVQGLGAAVQGIEARIRGDIGVRSLQDWATYIALTYDALFDRVLTRVDPERAHRLGFRAIRAGAPLTRRLSPRPRADRHARDAPATVPGDGDGPGVPEPPRPGRGVRQERRRHRCAGRARLRLRRDRHGDRAAAAGEPPAAAVPAAAGPRDREPAGLQQRRRRGRGRAARPPRGSARPSRPPPRRSDRPAPQAATLLGINIGKTKVVPEDDEQAVLADYALSARLLAPYADYLVVNVSSPNTPGLRSLQAVDRLAPLLDVVRRAAEEAAGRQVPLCVKIAPDLADDDVVAVAELARSQGLDGIIATNTTISRDGLTTDPAEVEALGAGGLSGPVLRKRSLEVLTILRAHDPRIAIISVGGITTVDDARIRLRSGADLVQAYTGFVYGGPLWPRRIVAGLAMTGRRPTARPTDRSTCAARCSPPRPPARSVT